MNTNSVPAATLRSHVFFTSPPKIHSYQRISASADLSESEAQQCPTIKPTARDRIVFECFSRPHSSLRTRLPRRGRRLLRTPSHAACSSRVLSCHRSGLGLRGVTSPHARHS